MKEPIQVLKDEHRIIEKALGALDGLCDRLERGAAVPPNAMEEIGDFIANFADRFHHAKEEAHLFPVLEQNGVPKEGGPVGVMLDEHESGRRMAAAMRGDSEAYGRGDPKAGASFAESGRLFSGLLRSHIQKEDNILFMIAGSVLDEGALGMVSRGFEAAQAQFDRGFRERYQELASRLERDWAGGGGRMNDD